MDAQSSQQVNEENAGTFSRILSWVGFVAAMVLMFAYIPVSDSITTNALVGAVCGLVGSVIGAGLGSLLDAAVGS